MAYEDSVIEDSNPVTVIAIDSGRVTMFDGYPATITYI